MIRIHNETNTNTDIIEKKLEQPANGKQNCVLLTTGSFNPIHHSHIKNLKIVKEFIENHDKNPMNVLAAYISPTHDEYVRGKLGKSAWIKGTTRVELCEKAIEEENQRDFIVVSRGELDYNYFADFDQVSIDLAAYLNKKFPSTPITVVYVCGLDHFNKCPYVEQLAKEENMASAIIYRIGSDDKRIKSIKEELSNRIYYLTLDDEIQLGIIADLSSTEIRNLFTNAAAKEEEEQQQQQKKSVYKCVFEYYDKNKQQK